MTPVYVSSSTRLEVPPMDVWSFFADTDRMNQLIGLPAVRFSPSPGGQKGHYRATIRILGVPVHYEELPFDWVEGRYYKATRRFARGPFESLGGGVRLEPADGGTLLEVFAEINPRNAAGTWLARVLAPRLGNRKIISLAKRFERHYKGLGAKPVSLSGKGVNKEQLAFRLAALKEAPLPAELVSRLGDYLATASDLEVSRLRPLELAEKWGTPSLETLRLFLQATRAGVLDLGWHVLCPRCNAVSGQAENLSKLKAQTHCDTCQISFDADLASSVEARFSPNPAIRRAQPSAFCIGGPASTPYIAVQWRLSPGETRQEEIDLKPGKVRVRSYQAPGVLNVEASPEAGQSPALEIHCADSGVNGGATKVRSGPARLTIVNALNREALVVLERSGWRDLAATAALVMSLQDFRDLFPTEAAAPGQELRLASLAVLFTDLSNSTSLYEKVGDSKAFAFVENHFRYLVDCIASHKGGIVKTMGDAVMASFASAKDALEAALQMQKGWGSFIKSHGGHADIRLKVGLHQGPCITINNKGQLDYFGAMINTGARVQGQSAGGDIILTPPVWEDPGVQALQAALGLRPERVTASLKGILGEQILYRIMT